MSKPRSQTSNISIVTNHLMSGKSITSWEAIEQYGITRLASIILDIKKRGELNIRTSYERNNGIRRAVYSL